MLLVCGVLLLAGQARAADRVPDVSQMDQCPVLLTGYFSFLEDPHLVLSVEDLRNPNAATRFKAGIATGESLNFSYTVSAIWLRLHVQNTSDAPLVGMLEIANPLLAHPLAL